MRRSGALVAGSERPWRPSLYAAAPTIQVAGEAIYGDGAEVDARSDRSVGGAVSHASLLRQSSGQSGLRDP